MLRLVERQRAARVREGWALGLARSLGLSVGLADWVWLRLVGS